LNYISSGLLQRIFSQTEIFAGFSLHIINLSLRISAAAIAGDLISFSLGGQVGDYTGAHTVIYWDFFYILFARWNKRSCNGRSVAGGGGEGGNYIFRVPNSLEGCDGWDRGGDYCFDHGDPDGKIYAPGGPTSGMKGSILFLGDE
jgi:hypothetical protein